MSMNMRDYPTLHLRVLDTNKSKGTASLLLFYISVTIISITNTVQRIILRLLHPYFVFMLITLHLGNKMIYTPNNIETIKIPRCSGRSTAWLLAHFRVLVILIIVTEI
jgi:hypothetical protein